MGYLPLLGQNQAEWWWSSTIIIHYGGRRRRRRDEIPNDDVSQAIDKGN